MNKASCSILATAAAVGFCLFRNQINIGSLQKNVEDLQKNLAVQVKRNAELQNLSKMHQRDLHEDDLEQAIKDFKRYKRKIRRNSVSITKIEESVQNMNDTCCIEEQTLYPSLTPSPSKITDSNLKVRKSIRELEDLHSQGNTGPLDKLMSAWYGIKSLPFDDPNSFFTIAGYHGWPCAGPGCSNGTYWGGWCQHNNVLFPTWHRAYLMVLEKALKTIEPEVVMAYWDETSPKSRHEGIPKSFTQPTYSFGHNFVNSKLKGETVTNPLLSFNLPQPIVDNVIDEGYNYTKLFPYETKRFPFSGLWNNATTIANSITYNTITVWNNFPGKSATQILNENVMNWTRGEDLFPANICCKYKKSLEVPDYTSFSNSKSSVASLETPHGDMHLAVGGFPSPHDGVQTNIQMGNGDMGENENAAMDPIFFFHHAFIDKLFWQWQKEHKSKNKLVINQTDPGAKVNSNQGATSHQTLGQSLTTRTRLHPFTTDGIHFTSRMVTNIETQLLYTYSEETPLSCDVSCKDTHDHKKHLLITGIDDALFKGSYVVKAYVKLKKKLQYVGYSSHFGTYRTSSSNDTRDHLFSLESFSNADIGKIKDYKLEILHHGSEDPQFDWSHSIVTFKPF